MCAHALGGPETSAYEKEREKPASLPAATYATSGRCNRPPTVSGRKGSCPGGPEAARPSPEPALTLAARAFPMAEATGGRCPRLERLGFGLLNRRPSFRAPDWVDFNFRSFSLRGKGLVSGPAGVAGNIPLQPPTGPVTLWACVRPHARTCRLRLDRPGVALCPKKYELLTVDDEWHGLCRGSEQDLPRRTSWPN